MIRLVCALALLALCGCAAILPAAVATEPLWGPLVEDLAKGAVEGLTQKDVEPQPRDMSPLEPLGRP